MKKIKPNGVARVCKAVAFIIFLISIFADVAILANNEDAVILALGILAGGGLSCLLLYALGEIIDLLNKNILVSSLTEKEKENLK